MATTKIPAEFLSINAIQGTLIADNAVTTVHIAQNAITSVQIPNNSIGTVQIALNTVTSTHIAQNQITTIQLANNSVQTLNIADDQVTADKLAASAVVTASIVDLNVTEAKIANNAVTASKIPDGSITATQIGANAVTLAKMASLTRGSILIGNSSADVTALGIGTSGYVLKSDGTDIAWAAEQTTTTLTTAAQSSITSLGTLTTLTVDDITINGSTISDGGDLTLDVGGDIFLDAATGYVKLLDGGTEYGRLYESSNRLVIQSMVSDGDLLFSGVDGGSGFTALTLDMSEAGHAIFNSSVNVATHARGTLTTDNDGSFDMNASNNFKCTPSGNFTLTFTNISAQSGNILLINSGGHTVSAHANTKVDANILGTISTAGTYLLAYFSDGTNAYMTNSAIYT